MPRLRAIQALRAAAALAVVLYHAFQWSSGGFKIGAAGVDLFFVISGVVMGLVMIDPRLTPAVFLRRRFWRIAPPYWIVSLGLAALALAWPRALPEVYLQPRHMVLSLMFLPHLDPAGLPFPLLPVGWSLNYEAIFYLVVAASLGERPSRRFAGLACGLLAIMLLGVVVRPAYFLFANPMLFQFMAGAAIAAAYVQGRLPRHGAGLGLMAAGLAAYLILSRFDLYSSLWRPLLWGAPAALVTAGAVALEAEGKAPRSRLVALLGEASYSIYLCHWPVVVILARGVGGLPAWAFIPTAFAASVLTGLACWRFVERPLLRWGQKWTGSGAAPAQAAASA